MVLNGTFSFAIFYGKCEMISKTGTPGELVEGHDHSSDALLSHMVAKHRTLLDSRPEITTGGIQNVLLTVDNSPKRIRISPRTRCPRHGYGYTNEPYRTFAVIPNRPNFLTAPGVLFLLADRSELQEELSDILQYQVWCSAGITEMAQRLTFPS